MHATMGRHPGAPAAAMSERRLTGEGSQRIEQGVIDATGKAECREAFNQTVKQLHKSLPLLCRRLRWRRCRRLPCSSPTCSAACETACTATVEILGMLPLWTLATVQRQGGGGWGCPPLHHAPPAGERGSWDTSGIELRSTTPANLKPQPTYLLKRCRRCAIASTAAAAHVASAVAQPAASAASGRHLHRAPRGRSVSPYEQFWCASLLLAPAPAAGQVLLDGHQGGQQHGKPCKGQEQQHPRAHPPPRAAAAAQPVHCLRPAL